MQKLAILAVIHLGLAITHVQAGSSSQGAQVEQLSIDQDYQESTDLIGNYIQLNSAMSTQEDVIVEELNCFEFNEKYENLIKNYVEVRDEIISDQDRIEFNIYVTTMLIEYVAQTEDLNALHHFFPNNDDEYLLVQKIVNYLKDMELSEIKPRSLGVAMIAEDRAREIIAKYEKKGMCLIL